MPIAAACTNPTREKLKNLTGTMRPFLTQTCNARRADRSLQKRGKKERNTARHSLTGRGAERYLPAAVAEQQQSQRDGGARHGVGGRHAVLGVVEDLQLHHGRGGGPRPADDILGALPQVHHPHPDDDQPAAQPGVQVPDAEGKEEDVEELVAQLGA